MICLVNFVAHTDCVLRFLACVKCFFWPKEDLQPNYDRGREREKANLSLKFENLELLNDLFKK